MEDRKLNTLVHPNAFFWLEEKDRTLLGLELSTQISEGLDDEP